MMKALLLLSALYCATLTLPVVAHAAAAAKAPAETLTVTADRADALYARGEVVTFTVELRRGADRIEAGEITWTLTKDGVEPKRTGRTSLEGGRAEITGTLAEPGFLQCRVELTHGGKRLTALGGAAIDPRGIKPSLPVPDDFDAFWSAKKAQLARVPVNARLTSVSAPRANVEAFDLQADSVGAPVSGYYARPRSAPPKSLPAILLVHGAGVRSAGLSSAASWAGEGALALEINAHGLPNGREQGFYDALANDELQDYRRRGRESRDSIYFLGMFLRLVRAIDFLTAQPEWDGRTVVVYGSSQGGAQAIVAAGLDARVTFFVAGVPAMCDHTGFAAGRVNGWPKFIATGEKPTDEIVTAVRYFDGVNFATRTKAPGFFTVGFIDTTCPPTGVYAAYNALSTPKQIHHDVAAGHTNTPAASRAMRSAAIAHFAAQRSRPESTQYAAAAAAARAATPSAVREFRPPYPKSHHITGVTFDDRSARIEAPGSDIWPITWAADDHLYTAWGDGGGFGGTNQLGRVLLGVARIEGGRRDYSGINIAGGVNAPNPPPFGGKSEGILALGRTLYLWRDGDKSSLEYFKFIELWRSDDFGATWRATSVRFSKPAGGDFPANDAGIFAPAFCQFGQAYAGARDEFVYIYAPDIVDPTHWNVRLPGRINLLRVPRDRIESKPAYEFFTGMDSRGRPRWTRAPGARKPTWEDSAQGTHRVAVSYNPALERYLLTTITIDRSGWMSVYDAPEPWGPWTHVHTEHNPERWGTLTILFTFVNKWLGADGRDFVIVHTRNDHWASIEGRFELAVEQPRR